MAAWDALVTIGETDMFHVGALSAVVTAIETPGWTTPYDLMSQIKALSMWGPSGARLPEADLLTAPDAVSIGTVHSAKGPEWAAAFVADVRALRFPSSQASRKTTLPFEGDLAAVIDPANLADNTNNDAERRLMNVALTRAQCYLFFRHPLSPMPPREDQLLPDEAPRRATRLRRQCARLTASHDGGRTTTRRRRRLTERSRGGWLDRRARLGTRARRRGGRPSGRDGCGRSPCQRPSVR